MYEKTYLRRHGAETGKLVFMKEKALQIHQAPKLCRDWTCMEKKEANIYKQYVTCTRMVGNDNLTSLSNTTQPRQNRGQLPFSSFIPKLRTSRFSNWPSSAGMGPVYKDEIHKIS